MATNVPSLGKCCCCGCGRNVRNIVNLPFKHPRPGRGWGCFICDLPAEGAVAVVCDRCLKQKPLKLKEACAGYPAEPGRVPVSSLKGKHEHNQTKHALSTN